MAIPSSNTIGCVYGSRQNTDNVEIPGTLVVTGVLTATGGVAGAITGDVTGDVTAALVTATDIALGNDLTIADAGNVIVNATTGTKIGTATTQKLGFYNATPVVQPTAVTAPVDGAVIDAEARTAINAIITKLETLGLLAAN